MMPQVTTVQREVKVGTPIGVRNTERQTPTLRGTSRSPLQCGLKKQTNRIKSPEMTQKENVTC